MVVLRCLLLLATLLSALPLAAAETLLSDVLYASDSGVAQIEIRLGRAMEIAAFTTVADNRLLISLQAVDRSGSDGWSAAEMSFSEPDRLLTRVALEGEGRKGFELVVEFSEGITAQLLPQFDDRQVLLKVAPRNAFRDPERFGKPKTDDAYAINLESRVESVPDVLDIPKAFAASHTIYVTRFVKDDVLWHRLRLGFFPDRRLAQRVALDLRPYFPEAWIEQVAAEEVRFAASFKLNPAGQVSRFTGAVTQPSTAVAEVKATVQPVTPSTIGEEPPPAEVTTRWESRPPVAPPELSEIQKLFAEARSAFESGEYARAIELYSRLLEMTEGERRASALEMLGVSRELNRELPLAQQLYQSYLTQYPESEGAPRVRQRLAALLALLNPNRSQRRQTTRREPGRWRTASYLSQFYQRQSLEIDDDSRVPIDGIFSDASLLAMRNGTDLDQEIRVTLSYLLDFSDEEYPQGREFQVSSLYWDGYSERLRSGIKVGRQTRPKAGVLGRFDGAALTFRPLGNLSLDFTGGLLVDNAFESPDADRPFFGLGGEWISSSGRISVAPFYIRQEVDGVLDREAVGVQSYLRSDRMMLFSLLDYDLHYAALNNITLRGNFRFRESRLTASYEHRRSPYLTTRNAMIGQAYDGLSELETALLETQLEEIAEDRTATSDTLRLGVSLPLFENWMVTADLVASDYSSTETSADIIGLESYNTIYSSLQIRRNELFGPASYAALMFRQADSDAGGTSSLYWDNRFTLADSWLLYPRVRLDYRTFDTSGDTQWTVKPSLRLDFRYNPRVRFEFEMGYQWTTREMASRDLDITGLFVRAGYRANF